MRSVTTAQRRALEFADLDGSWMPRGSEWATATVLEQRGFVRKKLGHMSVIVGYELTKLGRAVLREIAPKDPR